MKTALVHDWMMTLGGAEKVFAEIYKLFPSPIHSLAVNRQNLRGSVFEYIDITTSFLQRFPFIEKKYPNYLLFFPMAIEKFDLSEYDVVISSSHAVAKGVLTGTNQLHISYFNGLMNYAWDLYHYYLKDAKLDKGTKGWLAKIILHYIRQWDISTTNRVDYYIANSEYMAKSIKKIYGRESTVIYPPVATNEFKLETVKDDYYLAVGRLVPIKNMDLIVRAFTMMPKRRLIILGEGSEMAKLKVFAGKNIELLGNQNSRVVAEYMAKAKALITASIEPFGISTVEAQACGTPVIAYGKGGSLEIVKKGKTGLFFDENNPNCIIKAVKEFEKMEHSIDPHNCSLNAQQFSVDKFRTNFKQFVDEKIESHFYKQTKPEIRSLALKRMNNTETASEKLKDISAL
ncbi:MAG: glycosyltransferase [candidate division Zixibacteria bacterium]|nr:glycosyltransferase [candidate division Zixibacteria bacterium]